MALYPGEDKERRIAAADLVDIATRIFKACGMSETDARLVAASLVHADLRGIHSHGVLRVTDYVAKLTRNGVDPRARPACVSDRDGALVIDGNNAMGQVAGQFAIEQVMARASRTGVAFAAVRGSNHCGALDWYTLQAARADMISVAGTNALPTMAPTGGTEKIVGLNPISIAIPCANEEPIVLDVALGATAHGKIRVYAQKGEPIPEGWAFDAGGSPTTDAIAALEGLIQPIGAHKGIGLAVMVGLIASVLSGAGYGTESGNMVDGAAPGKDGQFYMALDVSAFRDVVAFKSHAARVAKEFRDSRRMDGVDRLALPGDIERAIAARNQRLGIPLSEDAIAAIAAEAAAVGVDLEAFYSSLTAPVAASQ